MKTELPEPKDINALVAFLPRFTEPGFKPILKWGGGTQNEDGAIIMPWPEYSQEVKDFFDLAAEGCWSDFEYVPQAASEMLHDPDFVSQATLSGRN